MTLILSNADVDKLLTMPECMDALEEAYVELAEGRGITRTRSDSITPTQLPDAVYGLKSMDGVCPKLGVGAVRINSDIVRFPKRGNTVVREKVPAAPGNRWVGLVLLFSVENGEPLAIMPDGVMQRMRVGGTNGLGIKYLARKNAEVVGILGCGWQAGSQLMAACNVRDIKQVRCFSPTRANREKFAAEMTDLLGIEVKAVDQPEDAIKGADIAMCASSSLDHIFFAPWVETGMHMTSIKRPEIEMAALRRADRIVIHNNAEKPIHVMTRDIEDAESAKENGWNSVGDLDFTKLPTLPELIVGRAPGRTSERQITCFLNNIGLGYQFAAVGAAVIKKAKTGGIGHELPTDWFTEDVHP
jgi:ornithine cyclodeaminase/alanine dehydrogenase-like protein (mu-crystallin family)